jgi:predicted CoA-substrate-specific enzyme activase
VINHPGDLYFFGVCLSSPLHLLIGSLARTCLLLQAKKRNNIRRKSTFRDLAFNLMESEVRIGVDIGSVAIGLAVLENGQLVFTSYRFHHGEIRKTLAEILASLDFEKAPVALTGRGSRIFQRRLRVNNVVATVEGAKWAARKNPRYILLVGGENILLIKLHDNGTYSSHEINTDCASGTGVFLDQQAVRLGLNIDELAEMADHFEGVPPIIATRCAVFAKTDLVHSQQKGHPPAGIAAGLCDGVSLCLAETLLKDRTFVGDMCMAGGVSLNSRVVSTLEKILGRRIDVLPHAEVIPAIGAALQAEETIPLQTLFETGHFDIDQSIPLNPALRLENSPYPDFSAERTWREGDVEITLYEVLTPGETYPVYLGLDIGSTSTKLVLAQKEKVLFGLYTYTQSAPVQAVQKLFRTISSLEERFRVKFAWTAVGTTGSGRQLIGKLIHADFVINEITAHARAAVSLDPAVDTIIEIGGQDSKFIRVQKGAVVQGLMNYVCAAGTGSFVEEQAKRLNVPLQDYAGLALGRKGPVISDRCTVYMERDLSRLLAEGWPKEELLASVLHSVRDNYLMRVVGLAKLGKNICFQGATAKNKALVAAFEVALQKPIRVSRYCHLAGALGVCLLLLEKRKEKTDFVGLEFSSWSHEQRSETCSLCRNNCQIMVVRAGEETAAWGFQCGREYEDTAYKEKPLPFESLQKVYGKALESRQISGRPAPRRKEKIGLPRALALTEYLPLWEEFFSWLGFKTVISPQEKDILKRGKGLAQAEFCSPIFLAHGHVDWLKEKKVDFIFFPIMLHGPGKPETKERNFFCYYTSYTPVILHNLPLFKDKKNLLFPFVDFQADQDKVIDSLSKTLGRPLRLSKKQVGEAFEESWKHFLLLKQNLVQHGERILAGLRGKDTFAVVLLGRPYNILDSSLNQNIPDMIQQYGYRVLTQDMLDLDSASPEYCGDYLNKVHWHYGKKILRATELVLRHPNLFPVYITNFRCSPDAFIVSYFKELMERQGKPYLILQLDELSSEVGYQTRVEAALESFRNWDKREPRRGRPFTFLPLRKDKTWILPHLDDVVTVLAKAVFRRFGFESIVSDETPESIVQGLKLVGGGECVPTAALVGGIVQTIKKYNLDCHRTAALIPTGMINCNFPQIPLVVQSGLHKAGFEDLRIFTTATADQQFSMSLNIFLLKIYVIGSLLHQMTAKTRPYELTKGETEGVKRSALEKLSWAIIHKRNLQEAFHDVVKDFSSIKIQPANGERPVLVILGDLYVVCNPTFNQEVEKVIEEAGGEAFPSSYVDLSHFGYLNKIEKSLKDRSLPALAEAKALNAFIRFYDLKFRKLASPVLGAAHPLMEGRLLRNLRDLGIPPELEGETAQNFMKIFYYLEQVKPDGFVHINPLYCCPGVVSTALLHWVESQYGVPVIHLFYDGIQSPNENLEPYIYYLQKKRKRN